MTASSSQVNMLESAPCWQHWWDFSPILAHYGTFNCTKIATEFHFTMASNPVRFSKEKFQHKGFHSKHARHEQESRPMLPMLVWFQANYGSLWNIYWEVIMVVADGLVPNRNQAISNHHDDTYPHNFVLISGLNQTNTTAPVSIQFHLILLWWHATFFWHV